MKYKMQIPVPSENFQGRTRELNKLKEFFSSQHILIIAGIPGIGKTSLAMAYARAINTEDQFAEYHERVFWIHCEEDWKIDSLFLEINLWLSDRGIQDFNQAYKSKDMSLDEKLGNLVGVLERNNIALFLDDFQNIETDDTRLFIRYCKKYLRKGKVVVTTRKRIKLSAIDRVDIFERRLDGLSFQDAETLIIRLLKQHEYPDISADAIDNIVKKVKGHPFSIKLFVSLLITEDWTVEDLLEDSSEFEEEIEDYLIEKTYKILPEEEKDVLRSFSMFRTPVPLEALEYITKNKNLRSVRSSLVDKYLLEPRSNREYTMHDLLKEYCQQEIDELQKKILHERCAEYYEEQEATTHNKQEALYHYFEIEEYEKVQELAQDLIDEMERDGQLLELMEIIDKVLQCTDEMNSVLLLKKGKILRLWGKLDEALGIYQDIQENEADEILKANAVKETAYLMAEKGQYRDALEKYEQCNAIFEKHNDIEGMGMVQNEIAIIYCFQQNYEKALEKFESALNFVKKGNNTAQEPKIYSNIGNIYMAQGDYDKSLENLLEAMRIEKMDGNKSGYAASLYSVAMLHLYKRKFAEAYKYAEESLEIRKEMGDKRNIAYAMDLIGEILLEKDKSSDAFENFTSALGMCESIGDVRGQAGIARNIAKYYYREKNYLLAVNYISRSISWYDELGIKTESFLARIFEGLCYIRLCDMESCSKSVNTLAVIAQELGTDRQYAYYYKFCEIYFNAEKDYDQAGHYRQLLDAKIKLLKPYTVMAIRNFFKEEETEEGIRYIQNTAEGDKYITIADYEVLRQKKGEYDLWIDLISKEVFEKEKGEIKILKKRTLAPLFLLFVKNPGREFSFKELFEEIWEREYDFETDGITVRVNISRLRALLEKNKKSSKYIKISTKGGKYYFEKNCGYCVIMEQET